MICPSSQKVLSTPDLKRRQAKASQQEKYILYFLYSRRSDRRPDFEFIAVFTAECTCVRVKKHPRLHTRNFFLQKLSRSAIKKNRSLISNAKANDRVHKVPATNSKQSHLDPDIPSHPFTHRSSNYTLPSIFLLQFYIHLSLHVCNKSANLIGEILCYVFLFVFLLLNPS